MDGYASRFWVAIIVLLGALLTSTYVAMEYLRHSVQQTFYDSLMNQMTTTHQALKLWHLEEEASLKEWVQTLMSSAASFNRSAGSQQSSVPMEKHLIEGLIATESMRSDQNIILLSMDNRSLWQNRETNLLHPSMAAKINPFFKKVRTDGRATSHPMLIKLDNQAPVPVILSGNHVYINERQQWFIISIRTVRQALMPILNRSRLGRTGEAYLFNQVGAWLAGTVRRDTLIRAGLLLSDQKHALGLALLNPGIDLTLNQSTNPTQMQLPLIAPVKEAMTNVEGLGIKEYRDYLGREVVGAWLWDDLWELGIIIQQNRSEAFANLVWIQQFVWGALALVAFIVIGLTQIYLRGRTRFANANAELLAILHNTDFPIYLRDESDAIVDGNARYYELNLEKSLDEDSHRKLKKIEQQVLVTQLSINETLWVYLNHQRRVLRVNLFPVVLGNEFPVKHYLGGVMTDVTEQELMVEQLNAYKNSLEKKVEERTQQIQEQKAQMKALLDNAPDGIATIDDHGRVLYVNSHFSSLFHLKVKDCVGVYFYDLTCQSPQEALTWLSGIEMQTLKEVEVAYGNEVRSLELSFNPFYVSGVLYYSLVVRDATKEKALKQTLIESRNQAESAMRLKSLSIESLASELKIPAQTLMLSLDTLSKKMPTSGSLTRAVWSARMILQTLDDLQDYTSKQTGTVRLHKQPAHMYALFVSMRSMLMAELQERPVHLHMIYQEQIPRFLMLDAVKVQRIFLKLCLGSLMSLEQGQVEVEMLCQYEKKTAYLVLRTCSKGYGMTIEQLKLVFSSDKPLDSALARRFEEHALSRVWFNSALSALGGVLALKAIGDSTQVEVKLPVEVDAEVPVLAPFTVEDYEYRHCWLMIENEVLNSFVHNELAKKGIQVFNAQSALQSGLTAEQEQLLETKEPLLILDSAAWGRADTLKSLAEWHLDQLPQLMIGPAYFVKNFKHQLGTSHLIAALATPIVSAELTLVLLKQPKSEQLKAFLNLTPVAQTEVDSAASAPGLQAGTVVGG
jgi:PAS domain S-box-containing protein